MIIWIELFYETVNSLIIPIKKFCLNYSRPEQAAPKNVAFIELLYPCSIYKSSHTNVGDLWLNDGCGIELCCFMMSEYRFQFLLHMLRFDDGYTRIQKRSRWYEKLKILRETTAKITYLVNAWCIQRSL